jgi:hypothetical protein
MSAQITWQNIAEPGREHETIGVASPKTSYYVYDHGEGVFLEGSACGRRPSFGQA